MYSDMHLHTVEVLQRATSLTLTAMIVMYKAIAFDCDNIDSALSVQAPAEQWTRMRWKSLASLVVKALKGSSGGSIVFLPDHWSGPLACFQCCKQFVFMNANMVPNKRQIDEEQLQLPPAPCGTRSVHACCSLSWGMPSRHCDDCDMGLDAYTIAA